jgi:hypothetical protein
MKSFEDILNRNHRVELEKAWEGSKTRRAIIATVTYLAAAALMKSIGVENFLVCALVPAGGYLFSTLSLSIVKNWWIERKESSFRSDFHEVGKRHVSQSESALGGTQREESRVPSESNEQTN